MTAEPSGWVPETHTFAARLALIRQRMAWNVKEAALACKLPPSSWRGWELSGSRPHNYIDVCRSIAAATGADYDWLVDGRLPAPPPDGRQRTTVFGHHAPIAA